ncbi:MULTISPECIES: 23S rRNA (adenine(2503)-C(2))-methyltransferase RlmN [unclassified Coleofasciculus]|uniref:23S rRNA (adenine(2503)-C(2))-methyltransferase RlmN n=1 Tax=unclassified Coleofasciculus TaxID=2692782 RepID=UPI0018825730|nr:MULTISPECIES: 23S rRNA (adenine(2503)-C(2))-methyltransferase RlmN [unclassified Coleofasciculus]MBE9127727.1 23S rRNA (adenine(2503)-C(2))-methyltransferase RlmN [Coleofasciculus sp. LEGE 07081]MBE9149683.1 23S rRNA (adenine(2503)-C(2))-methyltransferase RlmN [Coleofasciculus sp. LEGE 07092]
MSATPGVSKVQSLKKGNDQNPSLVTQVGGAAQLPVTSIPPLLGASLSEFTEWVQQQGQPAYRGRQLHGWIYQKGARSLSEISVFPKQWREAVGDVPIGRSTLHYRSEAPDGTVKYLLRLRDGHVIETVGIPTAKRLTVCVSSQVGCPMACDFCATGKGGFIRNLERHEIVDQVLTVQEDFGERVSNVVFMGMGEPLLNLDAVVGAVKSINEDIGIGMRSLTISTVGIPGKIRQLAQYQLQVTFAVSLHASNQQLRERLIPSANRYPLEALLEDCREYVQITGRRVTFEYIVLAGVNDLPEHAAELAQHLRGFQSHVNLIPYNPISEADYQRPSSHQIQTFVEALEQHHIAVSVRRSRGLEKDAACGQLRASTSTVAV